MKVLVIVDMQKDFIDGSLGSKYAQEVYKKMMVEIPKYIDENTYVIFTRDTHLPETYSDTIEGKYLPVEHCMYGAEGREIPSELIQLVFDCQEDQNCSFSYDIINKDSFGASSISNYIDMQRDMPNEITVMGLCTDICVISNAMILRSTYKYTPIKVVEHLCGGTTKENHDCAIHAMRQCMIDII